MSLSCERNQTIYNNFKIQKKISSSKYSVYRAVDSQKNEVALKLFPTYGDGPIHFQREHSLIRRFNHPNIIKLMDSVEFSSANRDEHSFISLEFAKHGDLFEIISNSGSMDETLARSLFLQLLSGVSHMHACGVGHLDLKVDNILIDESLNLKITDFDLSQDFSDEALEYPLGYRRGTPGNRAPEVQDGSCKNFVAADIYSLAIVLFIMVTGHPPYSEKCINGLEQFDNFYKAMRNSNAKFWAVHSKHKGNPEFYSSEFIDLFNAMVRENPRERPSIEDIRKHPWVQKDVHEEEELKNALKQYLKKD